MVKLFTHTQEIEHCGECANCSVTLDDKDYCVESGKTIGKTENDLWGEIPSWCPLPEKKDKDV